MEFLSNLDASQRTELVWVTIGFGAQFLFGLRFLLQWLRSEQARKSVMPVGFWYLSVLGAALMLAYAIYRKDPVFILGQAVGLLVYLRNIWLVHKR